MSHIVTIQTQISDPVAVRAACHRLRIDPPINGTAAQGLLRGVAPEVLRTDSDLRQSIAAELQQVDHSLAGMMTDRPRRHLIRRPQT